MSAERLTRLDAAMKKLVDEKQVAGLVTLVTRHGKIVDFKASGQLDVRKSDPVTAEQCRNALVDEGASTLFDERSPQLRFATEGEAEAARQRLAEILPGSEPIWVITKEVGTVADWLER